MGKPAADAGRFNTVDTCAPAGRFHTLVDTCAPAGRFNTLEDTVTTHGERHLAMRDVLQKSIENAAEVLAP